MVFQRGKRALFYPLVRFCIIIFLWKNILLRTKKQKRFSVGWKIVFYFLIFCLNENHSGFRSDVWKSDLSLLKITTRRIHLLQSQFSTRSYFWYITPDLHVNSVTSTLSTFTWRTMASLKSWTVPALSLVILLRIFFFSSRSSTIVAIPVPIMLP